MHGSSGSGGGHSLLVQNLPHPCPCPCLVPCPAFSVLNRLDSRIYIMIRVRLLLWGKIESTSTPTLQAFVSVLLISIVVGAPKGSEKLPDDKEKHLDKEDKDYKLKADVAGLHLDYLVVLFFSFATCVYRMAIQQELY